MVGERYGSFCIYYKLGSGNVASEAKLELVETKKEQLNTYVYCTETQAEDGNNVVVIIVIKPLTL